MAEKPKRGSEEPPRRYRLDVVSIRLTHQPGHGSPLRRVSLAGTERAALGRDGQRLLSILK